MISVTVIVKNGERCLSRVLHALAVFDEVILFDTGSTDRTLEIARQFSNVKIVEKPFNGFGAAHNEAASHARHDWILSLDADEVASAPLIAELKALKLDPNCAYSLPFRNYFNGKWIRWCGWYPEKHLRLYNRKKTGFSEALVHEGVRLNDLKEVTLAHPVDHYPYTTLSDFLIKMERYSSLFAAQYKNKRAASPFTALIHGWGAFFKSYFLKRGFLGGYEGFVISFYNAHTAFYKYLKLYQINKCNPCSSRSCTTE